jgi:hypothetical protein
MKKLLWIVSFSAAGLLAQNEEAPLVIGGFENSGSGTFGYRFLDVSGYKPKYDELFNLQSGPRLLDFNLFGKVQEGQTNRFADDYSLTMSGLGGDPFTSTQFTMRKNRLYDLRANFRQSYYYWNQNDAAALPNGFRGLTSNHDWATVRKLGSLNLLVHATNDLRFSFEYYRNSRNGTSYTTRAPDYFGSLASWGFFARANPYYMIAPLDEMSNRVTGGIDYTKNSWALHYKIGYQSFESTVSGNNVASPQRSLNVDDANTAREPLNGMSWVDSRKLTTPVSEFSYTGKLTSRLETRGGYLFYRYRGPASLNFAFDGTGRNNANPPAFLPYVISMSGRASVSEPNNVLDQGFTYHIKDWWDIRADYRYTRFTVDATGNYRSVNNGVIVTGISENQWKIGTSMVDANMVFTPASSLLIRAGLRFFKSDVLYLDGGIADPARTKRINTVWPIGSVHYQPSKMFSVRADLDQVNNGTSYTRMTPHISGGGRFVIRFRPTERLYFEDTGVFRNSELLSADYRSTVRSNAFTANYDLSEKMAVFAGFAYDDFYSSGFTSFLRGTGPLTNTIKDQTVSRIWSGGVRTHIIPRLGIDFTGNYVRTTGMGEISGETPLYGPMSFPYASGSIYYDFPRMGRLSAQLQRTYYVEQVVPGNNFSANILTIAWTKGFGRN